MTQYLTETALTQSHQSHLTMLQSYIT